MMTALRLTHCSITCLLKPLCHSAAILLDVIISFSPRPSGVSFSHYPSSSSLLLVGLVHPLTAGTASSHHNHCLGSLMLSGILVDNLFAYPLVGGQLGNVKLHTSVDLGVEPRFENHSIVGVMKIL